MQSHRLGSFAPLVSGILGLLVSATGAPAVAADIQHGAQLARQWCAACHVVPGSGNLAVLQGPPPFRDIAREETDAQLRLFLMRPLGPMPPLSLSRTEIDDLVAYMRSLQN